jgi:hypothetical protein|tara:strand:- start:1227 stop:1592 length:366 start_codon:yes stop_codon:yes gene_type:complete
MLKPLLNDRRLVNEDYRCRFADGSMSLTLWFDEANEILGVEIIFDLLLDEHAFRWIRNGKARYVKVDAGVEKPTRHSKQILSVQNLILPLSRLEDFKARSANLSPVWRDFILGKLTELIGS